jgi:hypothetical protein
VRDDHQDRNSEDGTVHEDLVHVERTQPVHSHGLRKGLVDVDAVYCTRRHRGSPKGVVSVSRGVNHTLRKASGRATRAPPRAGGVGGTRLSWRPCHIVPVRRSRWSLYYPLNRPP